MIFPLRVLGAVLVMVAITKGQEGSNCPTDATKFQDYLCYQASAAPVQQALIKLQCTEMLGSLGKPVSIKYEAEQTELITNLAKDTAFWTSGKRAPDLGFTWEDGTVIPSDSPYWAEGEPGDDPNDGCLVVETDGKWHAVPCFQNSYVAVCESLLKWDEATLQKSVISLRHNVEEQSKLLVDAINELRNVTLAVIPQILQEISLSNGRIEKLEDGSDAVNTQFKEIDLKFDSTNTTLEYLNGNFTRLEKDLGDTNFYLQEVNSTAHSAMFKAVKVEDDVLQVQADAERLNNTILATNRDVSSLREELDFEKGRINAVETKLGEHEQKIDTNLQFIYAVSESLVNLKTNVTQSEFRITNLEGRVTKLENGGTKQ